MASRKFSRSEKRLVWGVSLGCLSLVLGALWMRNVEFSPALTMPPVVARPKPNGYDFYQASAKNLVANPALAEQQFALALRTPTMAPDARQSLAKGFVGLGHFRELTRAKNAEAKALLLQNRAFEAGTVALDAIQMSQDMARGAILAGKLQGAACAHLAVTPFQTRENLISRLNASQAQILTTRLEKFLENRVSMAQIYESDRWLNLTHLQTNLQNGSLRSATSDSSGEPLSWADRWAARTFPRAKAIALVDEAFDQAIADLKKPWSAPVSQPVEFPRFLESYQPAPTERQKMNESREIMPLRLLLLQLALQSYRAKNGRYPAELAALSPTILRRVPHDFYADEKPFRYVSDGKKYRLWSRGMDGKDDGGRAIQWPDGTTGRKKSGNLPPLYPDRKGDYVAGENS